MEQATKVEEASSGTSALSAGFGVDASLNDELSLDEDGEIGIDWATPRRCDMLTMSLRSDGQLAFAARLSDGRKARGIAQLAPEAFEVLAKLVTPNV